MADIKIHSKTISDRNNRAQIDLQRESRLIRFASINIYIYTNNKQHTAFNKSVKQTNIITAEYYDL